MADCAQTYAHGGKDRSQGLGEEIANAISHGLGALLAIAGTVLMIVRAATQIGRAHV